MVTCCLSREGVTKKPTWQGSCLFAVWEGKCRQVFSKFNVLIMKQDIVIQVSVNFPENTSVYYLTGAFVFLFGVVPIPH